MASNPVQLRLLDLIVRLLQPKRIIEIGAFIGLSAMTMARAMPAGGKLTTIEKFDHFADICRRNFEANGLADRITVVQGDAFEALDKVPKGELFDLAFIDGNKERYADYFEMLEPRVRSGGLILVDDVFFHGDVLNAKPTTEKGEGCKRFMELAARRHELREAGLAGLQRPDADAEELIGSDNHRHQRRGPHEEGARNRRRVRRLRIGASAAADGHLGRDAGGGGAIPRRGGAHLTGTEAIPTRSDRGIS